MTVSAQSGLGQRAYWAFYWPLMITGLAGVIAVQFQNATLARFPDAIVELAVFALAHSTFTLFAATLNFTPQLANLFARNPVDAKRTGRFVTAVSLLMMLTLLAIPLTQQGQALLASIYGLSPELLDRVCTYLVYLAPVLLLNGQRLFINGQLEQARLTGWVTTLNILFLSVTLLVLAIGFTAGATPVATLCGAQLIAGAAHWLLGLVVRHRFYAFPQPAHGTVAAPAGQHPATHSVRWSELVAFFIPVTATGVMFALSRPVLYAFVARLPDALVTIAALRVAFDFSMLFQQAANQFRSFWVTFGLTDLQQKLRFNWLIGVALTAVMLLIAVTPISRWILMDLLGVSAAIHRPAVEVIQVMCLLPGLIIWRNYYHGFLMVSRATNAMALGSTLRVLAIAACAHLCAELGYLNHIWAGCILLLGFLVETLTVAIATRRAKRLPHRSEA